jgi:hypothetical protein
MNPNILVKRIVKTNKIKLDVKDQISQEQLELEVKFDKLEETVEKEIEKKIIII